MASSKRESALTIALDMIDAEMAGKTWAMGDAFTMADCAAAPPLFYIDKVVSARRQAQERGALSRPPAGASVLCAGHRRGAAVFRDVSDLTD